MFYGPPTLATSAERARTRGWRLSLNNKQSLVSQDQNANDPTLQTHTVLTELLYDRHSTVVVKPNATVNLSRCTNNYEQQIN